MTEGGGMTLQDDLDRIAESNALVRNLADALTPHLSRIVSDATTAAITAHEAKCAATRSVPPSFRAALVTAVERSPVAAAIVAAAVILRGGLPILVRIAEAIATSG